MFHFPLQKKPFRSFAFSTPNHSATITRVFLICKVFYNKKITKIKLTDKKHDVQFQQQKKRGDHLRGVFYPPGVQKQKGNVVSFVFLRKKRKKRKRKLRGSMSNFHYVYIDCECYLDKKTNEILAFVGVLYCGEYKCYHLNRLSEVIKLLRAAIPPKEKLIILVYNWDYDGALLDYCESLGSSYTSSKALVFSDKLITTTQREKMESRSFPKWQDRIKDFPNTYVYDVCAELKGGVSGTEKGALEYHATKEGYVWKSTIDGNIFDYNLSDLEALEIIFLKQGGVENLNVKLYIIENILRTRMPLITKNLITYSFIKKNKLFPTSKELISRCQFVTAIDKFKKDFALPFRGYYNANSFWFTHKNDVELQEMTNVLHKFKMTLNKGGLHKGINGTVWESTNERSLFNLDFGSLYPYIVASELNPVMTRYAKEQIQTFTDERILAKKEGNVAKADALKLLLNSMYGMMKKIGEYAGHYITFIAQVSIVWLMSLFNEENTQVVDLNTDGIVIFTKLTKEELIELIRDFNSLCEKKLHKSKVEIQPLSKLYYKDYNNYIYLHDNKIVKIKGAFLLSTKLPKRTKRTVEKNGIILSERIPTYNVVNYQEIICDYLENKELRDAIVLTRDEDGHKIQLFNGVDFVINELDSPTIKDSFVSTSGFTSPRDLSVACVRGFLSHFRNDTTITTNLTQYTTIDSMNDAIARDIIQHKRQKGCLFVPFNNFKELTNAYCESSLQTLSAASEQTEFTSLLLAINSFSVPNELLPVRIVDLDFNLDIEKDKESRREAIKLLLSDISYIVYAEWFDEDYVPHTGSKRTGIHIFTTQEGMKNRFNEFFKEYQDKLFRSKVSRKNITMYLSPTKHDMLCSIGDINTLISMYSVRGTNRKETITETQDTNQQIKLVISKKEQEELFKSLIELNNIITSLPSNYDDWFKVISAFIELYMRVGLSDEAVFEHVYKLCHVCEETRPRTEAEDENTKRIIQGKIQKTKDTDAQNEFITVTWLKKFLTNSGCISPNADVITKEIEALNNDVLYSNMVKIGHISEFFKLTDKINILNAPTGAGKTHGAVAKIIDSILARRQFVYITDTKVNVKEVFMKVIEALKSHIHDTPTYNNTISKLFVLSKETNKRYHWESVKWVFTTYHFFERRSGKLESYDFTHFLLGGKKSKVDIYFDEFDEYVKQLEFLIVNGGRYIDVKNKHLGIHKDLTDYCYIKHNSKEISTNMLDRRSICAHCTFRHTSCLQDDENGYKQYAPSNILFTHSSIQLNNGFNFDPHLNCVGKEVRIDAGIYAQRVEGLAKSFDISSVPDEHYEEAEYIRHLLKNSLYTTKITYIPENSKGKKIMNTAIEEADEYPHYSCNVTRLNGVDVLVLVALIRKVLEKESDVRLYGFSATIQKNTMLLLNKIIERLTGNTTKLPLYYVDTSAEQLDKITILYKSGRFEYTRDVEKIKFTTPILVFYPRKKDMELVRKNNSYYDSTAVYYDTQTYSFTSTNYKFEKIKWVFTYSRSTIGRGSTFPATMCILNSAIYKPMHAYVLYEETMNVEAERVKDQIVYSLQNIGRILRGQGNRYVYLTSCSAAIANFIKKEVAPRSKSDIAIECVNGSTDFKIINKLLFLEKEDAANKVNNKE